MPPDYKTDAITEADLTKYLTGGNDDFLLEVEVFRACVANQIKVSHSGQYTDPYTNKQRQFDLQAVVNVGQLRLLLTIECKNIRLFKPVLVSRIPRLYSEAWHTYYLIDKDRLPRKHQVNSSTLYPIDDPVGKSITQVGLTKKNEFVASSAELYEKWSQATTSSQSLLSESLHRFQTQMGECKRMYAMLRPIVVVPDGALWAVDYDEALAQVGVPHQVDECQVFHNELIGVGKGIQDYRISHIEFFTKTKMLTFLKEVAEELTRNHREWMPEAP